MALKHTPGPWRFYVDAPTVDDKWHLVAGETSHKVIANVHVEPGNERDIANIRLLTAAPELLEALELLYAEMMNFCGYTEMKEITDGCVKALAVIKKAKGET